MELGCKTELNEAEREGGIEGRRRLFEKLCARVVERNDVLNAASLLEVDAVIDVGQTRERLLRSLETIRESR